MRKHKVADRRSTSFKTSALLSALIAAAVVTHAPLAHANIGAAHDSLISEFASFNTPGVVDGRIEAIAVDGDTVYVGGTFTQIHNPLDEDNIINQPYLFAYSKSTGDIIQSFDPQVNNTVFALETTGEPSGGVFAGGKFGNLNGQTSRGRLAKIDINGDRVPGFSARPDATITSMVRLNDTLYVGGNFSRITRTDIERLAAIDTATGAVSPNLNLDFGGLLTTSRLGEDVAVQGVDDIDITSDGRLMAIVGNFESIDGISRTRLALLELEGQARVSDWNTDVYDIQCPARLFPQYIQGIDISTDDSYLVVGSNGYRFIGVPACDAINRFELDDLTNTDLEPTWTNYTGGDSVYEVVATDHAIYAGGHFRWLNNDTSESGNDQGEGAIERRGLAALDPLNGLTLLDWRADRNPRGVGVFTMISEPEGVYFGDDTDFLNGSEHRKLKFIPTSTNVVERPIAPTLPTTIVTTDNDALVSRSFNGNTAGSRVVRDNGGWANTRGAVFVGGRLFYANDQGRINTSVLLNGVPQGSTEVNLFGLTSNEWNISEIGAMFFDYELGRIYYTLRNNSQLFYRAFTPSGPYFGNERSIAASQADIPWGDVRGMDVIDGHLYYSRTDGKLYRAEIDGVDVISGTSTAISGPGIDTSNWSNNFFTFMSDDTSLSGNGENAQFEFESTSSNLVNRFQTFEFSLQAGDPLDVLLQWDDTTADVALFVRDPNDQLVDSDNVKGDSPKFISATATTTGTYVASVLVRDGSTSYTVQVNPFDGLPTETAPTPVTDSDFSFSSSGSPTEGKWQVFSFEVNAGDLVEATANWVNNDAKVRLFLRDENGKQVDKDIDGGMPASVSATATTSGTWSVGVSVFSGSTDYEIGVNTN